jgi:hypothetical protein
MSRRSSVHRLIAMLFFASGIGIGFGSTRAQAFQPPTNADVNSASAGKFVVHEWGTFTTFSGSNGVHLDFRPLRDHELPNFVFDRASQHGYHWIGKGRLKTRVRMETPITYFYTDEELQVEVDVEFPRGLLTEFYPPVRSQSPTFDESIATSANGEPIGNAKLHWGEITLIPMAKLRPAVSDPLTSRLLGECLATRIYPDATGNHYDAARHTDSALVHIRLSPDATSDGTATTWAPSGDYFEKFLFYRGVGKFDIPVTATSIDHGTLEITNHGAQSLQRSIVYRLSDETLTFGMVPDIRSGQTVSVPEPYRQIDLDTLSEVMRKELISAGLYEKEATAMINTWTSSWFMEQGTRLFYFVPQEITDRELPLHISPRPHEQLRVMVGRVEIMSASEEQRLIGVVKQAAEQRSTTMNQQLAQGIENPVVPIIIPDEFRKLGRLAEPALHRLREISPDTMVRDEAEALLAQLAIDRELEEIPLHEAGQAAK